MATIPQTQCRLSLVPARQKHIIHNLMQFYFYDFTQFLDFDVNMNGEFDPYPDLDEYWIHREERFPFLIICENLPAGFALVERMPNSKEADYYLTEFFVMKKYRRSGLGTWAAYEVFDRLQGSWKVTQVSTNQPAQSFWRKIIHAYTDGDYLERTDPSSGNPSQYFQSR
ncbi:GNAT family N-acetyltransferase [Paenibacillus lemnae]|uniref:GNAT family N-acetyltransferase n=1 Tax=Paenibacillus lemnae TaxID=1330551 RepID=A0A848M7Q9_PAELE|nr:GNAT family N-acetyltransferase [Paenibacillus lemnae]NMO95903.1 GNAT family N-acetyltransferase [Paenibacillus lemnae]